MFLNLALIFTQTIIVLHKKLGNSEESYISTVSMQHESAWINLNQCASPLKASEGIHQQRQQSTTTITLMRGSIPAALCTRLSNLNATKTLQQEPEKNLMTHTLKTSCLPTLSLWFTDSHIQTHTSCRTYGPSLSERECSLGVWTVTFDFSLICNPKRDRD